MTFNIIVNIFTVVFDGPPPPFIVRTLRDGTPQVLMPQSTQCPVRCFWCFHSLGAPAFKLIFQSCLV